MAADVVPIRLPEPAADPIPAMSLTQGIRDISERLLNGDLAEGHEALGRDLAMVRTARQVLAKLEERIENELYEQMPAKIVNLPGVGTFERRAGKEYKKPKTPDLLRRLMGVARRQNVDMTTGEMQKRDDEAFIDVLEAACRVEGWRVTYLRGHGIDVEDYFDVQQGRNKVQFTPSE